uniref:Reelin domain-containing protein n=1 Tax=Panagrellus redivivus TaxID=6233 RepID=A0A7E4ZY69_PANRE
MNFQISITLLLASASFVLSNSHGYRSEHYVRASGDFFCHGKPFDYFLTFYQDKDATHKVEIGTGKIQHGSLEYVIAAYDDIINPLLDIYAEMEFKCDCLKVWTSEKSPRSAKVERYNDVFKNFWYLGNIELSKLC